MYKKQLQLLIFILNPLFYQPSFAHGGGDSSYTFDKKDLAAERAAEKKAVEKKHDQDDWAKFMEAVNTPKKQSPKAVHDHAIVK